MNRAGVYKWESIKKKAKDKFDKQVQACSAAEFLPVIIQKVGPTSLMLRLSDHVATLRKEARKLVHERIDSWDVRAVHGLIALFPGCVPAKYAAGTPMCYIDEDDGEWYLDFNYKGDPYVD